jgi:hypothetical protein
MTESERIAALLHELLAQPERPFPQPTDSVDAPKSPGVYIIRNKRARILYVGRTRAKGGLSARLHGHLNGRSVFARGLPGGPATLRDGYRFQCLAVPNDRTRALLEYLATGTFCPQHLGVGLRNQPPR